MSDIQFFQKGLKVWVESPYRDDEKIRQHDYDPQLSGPPKYVPAKVTGVKDGQVLCQTSFEPIKEVCVPFAGKKDPAVFPVNETINIHNMEHFSHLHPPALLRNVHLRFEHKQIYTLAGQILLAMNPYKEILIDGIGIYGDVWMKKYRDNGARLESGGGGISFDVPPHRPGSPESQAFGPHLFHVADLAFRRLIKGNVSQSCVISGESGAGKVRRAVVRCSRPYTRIA